MSLAIGCVAENTPKYLGQALRLVQSIRWFGGSLNQADMHVCVVDDIRDDYRKELERYNITIRLVSRFSTKHPQSNKLRFLELPELAGYEQILLLDCDTIVVRDPTPGLFRADFSAKIADIPTIPLDTFRRLFAAFALPMPEINHRCTVRGEPTIPYFNAGVLAFTRQAMNSLVQKWIALNLRLIDRMELLEAHKNFCEQGSLSLALTATSTSFETLGNAYNFPMHFEDPAATPGLADIDPFIIHYHWLADPSGNIMSSSYPLVNKRIDEFNARLRQERETHFDNRLFWNQRYAENPELGSGIGSRGEARDYKRRLLEEVVTCWKPCNILDVGCGDLEVGSALPAKGYTGLDYSEIVIAANKEKYPDRNFLNGNFIEMPIAPADMVICLDVLIHLDSPENYRNFVHQLVRSTSQVGIVAGDEVNPALGGIVFFHEPLSQTLAEAGATNIRKIGAYRHVTIFEFTPPPIKQQQALIVLGMHRSGTSALTGVLSLLGIHPGDTLMPAVEDVNPKGFWEHAEIVSIHDQMLEALGSSWNDETPLPEQWWLSSLALPFRNRIISVLRRDFSALPIWLIKDPRMCRLLPLWQDMLHELNCQPLFVLALRHPSEVAHSLLKRDNLIAEASCLLWLNHMLEAEYQTRGQPRTFVTYERLLSDWQTTMADIGKTLCIAWPVAIEDASFSIEAFLDPSLRHHADNATLPDHPACHLAQVGFKLLSGPSPDPVKLDSLRAQAKELASLVTPWSKRLHCSEGQIRSLEIQNRAAVARLESENEVLHAEIKRVKSTVSWQITKPLRFFSWFTRSPKLLFNKLRNSLFVTPQTNCHSAFVPFGYPVAEWKSTPNLAVICHMFYVDMIDELASHILNIPFPFDLYITTDTQEKREKIEKYFSRWKKGKIEVRIAPNRGRDIAPTLITCRDVYDHYEYILHIHTKKSPHHGSLHGWRSYLLETLLGSNEVVKSIFEVFRSFPNIGMIAPQHFEAIHKTVGWGRNFKIAKTLANKMGMQISRSAPLDFPSGSMFWARSAAIKPLLDCNLALDDFPDETGQLDKTLGHAIERLFFFSCELAGYEWIKISRPNLPIKPCMRQFIGSHDDLTFFISNSQYKLIK